MFIRSGIRFDYLIYDKNNEFFKELVSDHVSGQLKVAPEHCSKNVLNLMGKPEIKVFNKFRERFFDYSKKADATHPYGGTKISTLQLANSGTQVLSTAPIEIAKGGTPRRFFVMSEYKNETATEQLAQGVFVKGKVDIIGIQKGSTPETQSNWYDADNGLVTFATSE